MLFHLRSLAKQYTSAKFEKIFFSTTFPTILQFYAEAFEDLHFFQILSLSLSIFEKQWSKRLADFFDDSYGERCNSQSLGVFASVGRCGVMISQQHEHNTFHRSKQDQDVGTFFHSKLCVLSCKAVHSVYVCVSYQN